MTPSSDAFDKSMKVMDAIEDIGNLDLADVERLVCPICSTKLVTAFHPSGKAIRCVCPVELAHFPYSGDVVKLPVWWKSLIDDKNWVEYPSLGE